VEVEAAVAADGVVLGLRARLVSDAGAYHVHPFTQALEPLGTAAILPGPYRIPAYAYTATAVSSPKPPLGAYRGVGMAMGAFVMERTLDLVAARLGLDPAEVRRRNLIPRDAYPFTSASGLVYDSGDFPAALDRALALARYDELRREQTRARTAGRRLGIGISCYTEYTGMGSEMYRARGMVEVGGGEAARLALAADGRALLSELALPGTGARDDPGPARRGLPRPPDRSGRRRTRRHRADSRRNRHLCQSWRRVLRGSGPAGGGRPSPEDLRGGGRRHGGERGGPHPRGGEGASARSPGSQRVTGRGGAGRARDQRVRPVRPPRRVQSTSRWWRWTPKPDASACPATSSSRTAGPC
jgi:hypothetical protein